MSGRSKQSQSNNPPCFASQPRAIERWKALLSWFEKKTGLAIGPPPAVSPSALHPPGLGCKSLIIHAPGPVKSGEGLSYQSSDIVSKGLLWTGLDPRLVQVMTTKTIAEEAYGEDFQQWLLELAGYESYEEVKAVHKRLRQAAQTALDAHKGKAWSWRGQMPPHVVEAAEILAHEPTPFPTVASTGRGDRVSERLRRARRHKVITVLDSIRCPDRRSDKERQLSETELTALYMLTFPYCRACGDLEKPRHGLWVSWVGGPPECRTEKAILKSEQFEGLKSRIKSDRMESRKRNRKN